jgi:hypothetical protein
MDAMTQALIIEAGTPLGVGGQSEPMHCPFCEAKHETKFSVKRVNDGLVYNCFRGKCGAHGFVNAQGVVFATHERAAPKEVKPYDVTQLSVMTDEDLMFFRRSWGLTALRREIYVTPDDEYAFRIRGADLNTNGWHIRQPIWRGTLCHRSGNPSRAKGMTYKQVATYSKCAFFGHDNGGQVVLVEDYLSAMKVAAAGFRAVCLFGTMISEVDRQEIRSLSNHSSTTLWLDADAQEQAYANMGRWGVSLNMRVITTNEDPKVLGLDTIRSVLQ